MADASGEARLRLRDDLVLMYLPLAYRVARRFAERSVPIEDLRQVAALALVKAVDRFDPTYGTAFSSYALPTIRGEIKRHFRDHGWAVTVSRRLKDRSVEIGSTMTVLSGRLGRTPSTADVADHLGLGLDEVREALQARQAYATASFDTLLDPEAVGGLDARLSAPDADLEASEEFLALRPALATLTWRERQILAWRFYVGLTQREVAARLGISQMHVSRLQAGALRQLRDVLTVEPEPAAS